ncbi:restriction endonuclease subunit S [Mycoplasmopsis iners]|uniref:restriction endonuclease subunit S n=1 Tax=Mycoplasmopsis iners TaxID=76630 RepID=UPI0004955535|nr:restriction endonuclease subunit S [Mycoplasmopsis iners]
MNTVKLKDISIGNKGSYGIGASAYKYEPSLPQYLRITDISDDSRINIPLPACINVDEYPKYKNYFLNENDIVFARTGNSTGRNYFHNGSPDKIVYAGYLIRFSIDSSKINPRYVGYYCQSNSYWKQVKSLFTGSTRSNLNAIMYGELNIPILEPSKQQHIVNIILILPLISL